MVKIDARVNMAKWWFTSLFFRKKKCVQPEPPVIDFGAIDSVTTLSCPTRTRVKGPQGRKKPTRASCPPVVREMSHSPACESQEHQEESKESMSGSDSNFNQTTTCNESLVDDHPARHPDVPMDSSDSPDPTFDSTQVV